MDPDTSACTPAYVAATASRLRRAAAELQQWAGSADAVPSLPVTLAHIEDALDRLAAGMQVMALSIEGWCGEGGAVPGQDALPAEARALGYHLRALADTLIDARDACPATSEWARRLLGDAATDRLRSAAAPASTEARRLAGANDLLPRPPRAAAKVGTRHGTSSRRGAAAEAA